MDLTTYTTPSLLWQRHALAYAQARAKEETARSDAFYDDVLADVAGEPLRILTPSDVLTLERLKSPFVTGGLLKDIDAGQVRQFVWLLSADNSPGLLSEFRLRRFVRRSERPGHLVYDDLAAAIMECVEYIDTVMQDSPGAGSFESQADKLAREDGFRRPLGAHLLAQILVPLASEVGPCDPYDGRPWQFSPLPRIFQYLKVAAASRPGAQPSDASPKRDLEAAWLREVNEARAAGILVGESGIPGSVELSHVNAEQVAFAHAAKI